MPLVNHIFAMSGVPIPPLSADLYEYIVAANGVFIRAKREGLSICLPITNWGLQLSIKGLGYIGSYFHLDASCNVPEHLLRWILKEAQSQPREMLWYVFWDKDNNKWVLEMPEQVGTLTSVHPTNSQNYDRVLIEIHSHVDAAPIFSPTDDDDEQGFRIYAVIGQVNHAPLLNVRLGIAGHFCHIPAHFVFDLPTEIENIYVNR